MLSPYRVLDLTDFRGEIGPMILGDMGADVIRIEPPAGSSARSCAPHFEGAPDDLTSLQFIAFNRNKRSIALDPERAEDRDTLQALIRSADFVFESAPERQLESFGIDFEELKEINPQVVCVRISPFGNDGPYASLLGNDLVVAALAGPMSLQGVPERAPVRVSVPQIWRHAGIEAAAAALAAHAKLRKTATAQFVDVSAQAALTWTMLNGMTAHPVQGADFERNGSEVNTGVESFKVVFDCLDGYMMALAAADLMTKCIDWIISDGILDESARETDWAEAERRAVDPADPYEGEEFEEAFERFFAKHTKQELLDFGMANDATLAPVNTIAELLELKQFEARDYWQPAASREIEDLRAPGFWAKLTQTPLSIRRNAPRLDEHREEILEEIARDDRKRPLLTANEAEVNDLPFEGLKVADFTWIAAGPISSKYLADHGATVIHVESESRPDGLRGAGPFKDGEPGWNRSNFFGSFNTSKLGLTLSMKSPEAQNVAHRLIRWADVVIESFVPGAISRMGLGYEQVRELNPNVIMLSTCLMGQSGPASRFAGYGYHAGAMAGFYEVTGWPDLEPDGPWMAYTDTIAPRFNAALLAAALDHRRRTGEGQYIDAAQIEMSLHFLAPEIMDYQATGRMASRIGNRARDVAPQGVYPCAGEDQWCAIAVDTDEQWNALRSVLGDPDWAKDPGLATTAGRLEAHDEIDERLAAWTREFPPRELMGKLQAAGVPAGNVQRSSDLATDPQYAHRGFIRHLDHTEMGSVPYPGHAYMIRGYDNGPRFAAPCLGEHSFQILSEILGMSEDEIGAVFASGAIS